jgi:sugar phosphate permease
VAKIGKVISGKLIKDRIETGNFYPFYLLAIAIVSTGFSICTGGLACFCLWAKLPPCELQL